ncbi:universal stress protein [Peribacillus sp. NPDC097295]|uniref:universal stress protein n=1 Tax=Peribacillus sp. NPDC097295 TaxID=3364402 RepID=UPI0037FC9847
MKELKRIVTAYDGNEDSKRAIEYGATLKRAFPEAVLTIVQVLNEKGENRIIESASAPGFVPAAGFYVDPSQTHPVTEVEHQLQMRANDTPSVFENNARIAESNLLSLLNEYNIKGEIEILEGNAPDSICAYAKQTDADLIIVGNSSKSGLERFFLGSTSSSIAKHAPCSVFIAK